MKLSRSLWTGIVLWAGLYGLTSCRHSYQNITITGSRTEMSAQWDQTPNKEALAVLAPFKLKVDSVMNPVIGTSAINMTVKRPESTLPNLVADVLRAGALPYTGQPADMGVINMGGLRSGLGAGNITYRNIYEMLPFENTFCVVTLKGKDVKELIKGIVEVGGEGLSNVVVVANKNLEIKSLSIGGKPIDDNALYHIATIDYLAEGNDQMTAFLKAVDKQCFPQATIRELFVEYIKGEAARGKAITARVEGRVTISDHL